MSAYLCIVIVGCKHAHIYIDLWMYLCQCRVRFEPHPKPIFPYNGTRIQMSFIKVTAEWKIGTKCTLPFFAHRHSTDFANKQLHLNLIIQCQPVFLFILWFSPLVQLCHCRARQRNRENAYMRVGETFPKLNVLTLHLYIVRSNVYIDRHRAANIFMWNISESHHQFSALFNTTMRLY